MNVLVVDDHPLMRIGVRQLIEREWPTAEVAEAETLADALDSLRQRRPDLVVLDLALPDTTGIEGVRRVLELAPTSPVLVLSQNPESLYAGKLLQLGVRGFLPKDQASHELITAVRRIQAGGRYVTSQTAEALIDLLDGRSPTALPHESLSAQEFRVMQMIAAGSAPAKIAETMQLSVKTVASYRARIFAKMGWKANVELAKYCVQHRLTEPT
jgi:two-component system invasion response regulator UvrY